MFLKNCWYMLGWSGDFNQDDMVTRKIMNDPLVIYRKLDGALVVLEDRCCHRLIALSVGKKEGDDVRCMYHGLKFGPDGQCNEIPGQERISSTVRVTSYPVAEKHSAAWVWMGDPALADKSLIPEIIGADNKDWSTVSSQFEIEGSAEYLCDNLLDLSHAVFVHEKTFGGGDNKALMAMKKGEESTRKIVSSERGVKVSRWHLNRTSSPFTGNIASDDWVVQEFLAPGVFILKVQSYKVGLDDRYAVDDIIEHGPPEEPIFARSTCQIVTPITEKTSSFYYNFAPWSKDSSNKQVFFERLEKALYEDKNIVEEQQKTINLSEGREMMMLAMDKPVIRYNNIIKRLLDKEGSHA